MIGQKGVPATFGGIERHVEELSRRLAAAGCEVTAYCRTHYTPRDATVPGVRLVRLPSVNTKHLDAITHTALATGRVLASPVDVVHYHALGPSSLAFLPRLAGKRVVVTVHGLDWRREKWGPVAAAFLRACEASATRFPHATIVVSRTLESHFGRRGARSLRYIPNGTPLPAAAPASPAEDMGFAPGRFLLFVGRLVPEKGLHVLLRAHREHVPEWPLAIAGEGHFTDEYVASCRRLAGENARFLGSVYGERLASLQQHAALVVAPSSLEGLSIALLEAMSFGRPVLASDIPENVEVVDGVGEVFRAGDAADLGRQLRALLDKPDRLLEMGRRARERIATEYDWDRVALETKALYEELLARRRR
jgi:glycosyltransferase involved in cell wall biosynthesis